jgi:chloramphenicol-sensitive protein RarD
MPLAGILYALAAYGMWGLLPVYWKALGALSASEVLAHRVLWTVLFTAALVFALGQRGDLASALRSRRERVALVVAGLLIGVNWLTFLWAVNHERIVETSLGYYLNPLVNVVLGVAVLGERLRRAQLVAVALAALGVSVLVARHGGVPWIALTLASTFGLYGLAHKLCRARPLAGLTIETGALAPLAAAFLLLGASAPGGAIVEAPLRTQVMLVAAGPVTALPLLFFASATRRLRLSTLGLFQYLAPTLSLLLAVFAYGEPFTLAHAGAFACIWGALALYTWDSWRAWEAIGSGGR